MSASTVILGMLEDEAVQPARRAYSEATMIRALARDTFAGHLLCVDNCNAMGSECDLLVVHKSLKCIDVEVKISRADLRADRKKDKWFSVAQGSWSGDQWVGGERTELKWPRGIWRHYYAIAADIWKPALLDDVRPGSGVFVVRLNADGGLRHISCERRPTSDKSAGQIDMQTLAHIARLTSLRLWDQNAAGWRGGK